jgi:hypothetical protein
MVGAMNRRWFAGVVAAAMIVAAVALPARSQDHGFQFLQPLNVRAVGGSYTVRWQDNENALDDGSLRFITWYCSTQPDGSDKKRIKTYFREDFSQDFRRNWKVLGLGGNFSWSRRKDLRKERWLLACRDRGVGPAISAEATPQGVVVSTQVQPLDLRADFTLGFRVQQNGQGFELRTNGGKLQFIQGGKVLKEGPLFEVLGRNWYWYEVGLRTQKSEVEVRVRIFDENHERLLGRLRHVFRPGVRGLLDTGLIALGGPAEFAEVYVDPWAARWADDTRNEFRWDTSDIPDGDYYLVAELADGKNPPVPRVSTFQVQVRNTARASSD